MVAYLILSLKFKKVYPSGKNFDVCRRVVIFSKLENVIILHQKSNETVQDHERHQVSFDFTFEHRFGISTIFRPRKQPPNQNLKEFRLRYKDFWNFDLGNQAIGSGA